jgi:S-adenosylmethionine synthetase
LSVDPNAKVACESTAKGNKFMILGEITLNKEINYEEIVKEAVKKARFISKEKELDYKNIDIHVVIERRADDQGLMFGYATNGWDKETLMPLTHYLASRLCEKLSELRNSKELAWLRPDCKSQVTIEYKKEGSNIIPLRVHSIFISTQHDPDIDVDRLRNEVIEKVIKKVIPAKYLDERTSFLVNPSKSFIIGSPVADAGLTGRKIIVDTYVRINLWRMGTSWRWCFLWEGVDRSAAYYCRYVAKSLVNAKLCDRVLVQVSYAIGMADPLSIYVDSYGTAKDGITNADLFAIVKKNFNFRPGEIIKELDLKRPIYQKTASYGHFGRMLPEFTWKYPKHALLIY